MRQWLDENLPPRITEVVKATAPAAIGKVLTNPESEQYATLVEKVSERIWTRYLDPNIEVSPLPFMVQTLVVVAVCRVNRGKVKLDALLPEGHTRAWQCKDVPLICQRLHVDPLDTGYPLG